MGTADTLCEDRTLRGPGTSLFAFLRLPQENNPKHKTRRPFAAVRVETLRCPRTRVLARGAEASLPPECPRAQGPLTKPLSLSPGLSQTRPQPRAKWGPGAAGGVSGLGFVPLSPSGPGRACPCPTLHSPLLFS